MNHSSVLTLKILIIFSVLLLFKFISPTADPLEINWSTPQVLTETSTDDFLLKSDLDLFLDNNKIIITWIKGKVGDSEIYLYYKKDSDEQILKVTEGHEDRDPRLFKFKDKYYIIFSRRIIEEKFDKKAYMTPSILMLTESPDLVNWSEPRILRINTKDADNHEPFVIVEGDLIRILWTSGNMNFVIMSTETKDLTNFKKPEKLLGISGQIHYPNVIQTGNGVYLLMFQVNHSIYFTQSPDFKTWDKPIYLMKHSTREYRPCPVQLPDERLLVFYNSSAYIWYTENLEKYNYDNWFKPIQLNLNPDKEELKDYMIQEIHPMAALTEKGQVILSWISKRNGQWNVYLSNGTIE